jgi:hypothetical protein
VWFCTRLCKKGCTQLAAASDKVYQLLADGRWLSLGTLASSTTKIGRHDIAEILLKVALKHNYSKSNQITFLYMHYSINEKMRLSFIDSGLLYKDCTIYIYKNNQI